MTQVPQKCGQRLVLVISLETAVLTQCTSSRHEPPIGPGQTVLARWVRCRWPRRVLQSASGASEYLSPGHPSKQQ